MENYAFSTLDNFSDTNPLYGDLHLLQLTICSSMWSPFTYNHEKRLSENSNGTKLLVFDFDSGETSLQDAKNKFATFKHLIGLTKSHQVEKKGIACDRLRVILFLDIFINNEEVYKWNYLRATEKYGLQIDKSCSDFARFYYPCTLIESMNQHGHLVEVELQSPEQLNPYEKKTGGKLWRKANPTGQKGVLSQRTRDFLWTGRLPKGSSRHQEFVWAASDLKGQFYSYDEAFKLLKAITGYLDDQP